MFELTRVNYIDERRLVDNFAKMTKLSKLVFCSNDAVKRVNAANGLFKHSVIVMVYEITG